MFDKCLISLDLDGTLLDNNCNISEESTNYIKYLSSLGHKIIIATGRATRALIKFYNQLELDTPIICYNGSKVYDPNDPNFLPDIHKFKSDELIQIRNNLDGIILSCMSETEDTIFADYDDEYLFNFYHKDGMKVIIDKFDKILNVEPMTFIARYVDTPSNRAKITAEVEHFPKLKARFWDSDNYFELFYEDVSKYNSILRIAKFYNIKEENIYAFGDADNDIEVITHCKNGVAMKNSSKSILEKAKFITEFTNNEDGVIKWLKANLKK